MTKKRVVKICLIFIIIAAIAGGAALYWSYSYLQSPVVHDKADRYIEIPRGTSPSSIIGRLEQEGIIRRGWPLLAYIKLKGLGGKLKAGEYRFPSPVSPMGVLAKLSKARNA